MKLSVAALSAKLESELGAGSVAANPQTLSDHAVDGKVPILHCRPDTPEQVAVVLRICAEADAAVVPWGGGTSMGWGNIPRRVEITLGLDKLDQLIEHDDDNLTATAQAGMTVAALQALLGRRRQFLPVDPPDPQRATLGGMVAANINGPRRTVYGGLRDLVIGMKMALASGKQIKAGGKVVKNVAGYDLCKLIVGSLGTLGIITELTFRLAPLAESSASFLASGTLDHCARFLAELSSSPLLPAAVYQLSANVSEVARRDSQSPTVAIWLEGFDTAIDRHLRELQGLADRVGLTFQIIRGEPHQSLWDAVSNFGTSATLVCRITVPVGSVNESLIALDRWSGSGLRAGYIADMGSGTIRVSLDADPGGSEWIRKLSALAESQGGHAIIGSAQARFKETIDVFGPAPPSLSLMREIKRQFDPQGILNPGRFLARI